MLIYKVWWETRSFGEQNEELYVNNLEVTWSRVSDESTRFPLLSLTMETPVIDAHWTSFHLPSNQLDEFEVKILQLLVNLMLPRLRLTLHSRCD